MTKLEEMARAIGRVMLGSIAPDVGTDDDVPISPEDIYAARACLAVLAEPNRKMVEKAYQSVPQYRVPRKYIATIFTAMIQSIEGEG